MKSNVGASKLSIVANRKRAAGDADFTIESDAHLGQTSGSGLNDTGAVMEYTSSSGKVKTAEADFSEITKLER